MVTTPHHHYHSPPAEGKEGGSVSFWDESDIDNLDGLLSIYSIRLSSDQTWTLKSGSWSGSWSQFRHVSLTLMFLFSPEEVKLDEPELVIRTIR